MVNYGSKNRQTDDRLFICEFTDVFVGEKCVINYNWFLWRINSIWNLLFIGRVLLCAKKTKTMIASAHTSTRIRSPDTPNHNFFLVKKVAKYKENETSDQLMCNIKFFTLMIIASLTLHKTILSNPNGGRFL